MIKIATLTGTLVISIILGTISASAATVFTNSYSADAFGRESTGWVQSSSFSLDAATSITGGTVALAGFGDLAAWDGAFDYWIFSDSSGPNEILASGAAENISRTDTGTTWCCSGNVWSVDFDFEESFSAQATTTYWLGIHLAEDFDVDDIFWVDSIAALESSESLGGGDIESFDNWFNYSPARAFTLNNDPLAPVPLPAALPLLGGALSLLGFLGWRRKQMAAA